MNTSNNTPNEIAELLRAATSLIADVRNRYPGEDLRCPHMIALDKTITAWNTRPTTDNSELIERAYRQGYTDGTEDQAEGVAHKDCITEGYQNFLSNLPEAAAALEASAPHTWRDIASAPRDGTIVLAYGETLPTYFYAITWEDGEWRYCSQELGWSAPPGMPTHWQPLPAPPAIRALEPKP